MANASYRPLCEKSSAATSGGSTA